MGAIFGSPSHGTSTSGNVNNASLNSALGSTVGGTGAANSAMAGMLGVGGNPAAQAKAFDQYKNSTGYNSTLQAGSQAITGNNASKGLLSSGATAKALSNFGQNTNQQYYNNYLNQLLGLGNQGIAAGGVLADSGKTSSQSETGAKPGLFGSGGVGSLLTSIPGVGG